MIPQPYPLWCAELHSDGSVSIGRVIAWHPDGQVPEVVFEVPDTGRLLNGVSGAHPGNPLFLGDTRQAAVGAAQEAAAKVDAAKVDAAKVDAPKCGAEPPPGGGGPCDRPSGHERTNAPGVKGHRHSNRVRRWDPTTT